VAALEPVLLHEAVLERVELPVLLEALDGHDRPAVRLDGENRARLDGPPVEEDGAGAAVRCVTPDMGAGEAEDLPEQVDQEQPRLDVRVTALTVDRHGHAHPDLLLLATTPAGGRDAAPFSERPPRARARDGWPGRSTPAPDPACTPL